MLVFYFCAHYMLWLDHPSHGLLFLWY